VVTGEAAKDGVEYVEQARMIAGRKDTQPRRLKKRTRAPFENLFGACLLYNSQMSMRIGFAQDSETCVPAKVLYSAEAKAIGAEKTGTGGCEEIDFLLLRELSAKRAAPG
jgi:hypothetical protein